MTLVYNMQTVSTISILCLLVADSVCRLQIGIPVCTGKLWYQTLFEKRCPLPQYCRVYNMQMVPTNHSQCGPPPPPHTHTPKSRLQGMLGRLHVIYATAQAGVKGGGGAGGQGGLRATLHRLECHSMPLLCYNYTLQQYSL